MNVTKPLTGIQMRLLERAVMKMEVVGELLRACLASNSMPQGVEQMLNENRVALENGALNILSTAHTEPDRDQATSVPTVAYRDGSDHTRIQPNADGMQHPQELVKRSDVNAFMEWTEAGIGEWRNVALCALEMNRQLRAELAMKSAGSIPIRFANAPTVRTCSLERHAKSF